MLRILGNTRRVCNGLSRREVLQLAGAGMLGVNYSHLLAADESRRDGQGPGRGRARSVIFLFLFGGPSQLETFDMKPDAPAEIRGPFHPIASRTPGLLISEHLPQLANLSNKYAVVRSVTHRVNNHNACHYVQTGHPMPPGDRGAAGVNATERDWPAMGSVVEYLDRQAGRDRTMPSYLYLPNRLGHLQGYDRSGQYAGWLGRSYNALAANIQKRGSGDNPYFRACDDDELDFRIPGLDPHPSLTLDRLDARQSLLGQFETQRRLLDGASAQAHDQMRQRALELVTSEPIRQALDLQREPDRMRDRYGRHLFGQSTLMARRLVEAGGRFITVLWDAPDGYSWDSHRNSNDVRRHLLPGLDQAFSALLIDLEERGLLDETLVVCLGEMGRTPRANATAGRNHWSYCFPAVFAGAGIRGGALHGRSDRHAAYPTENPVSPEDLTATVFDAMGFDHETRIHDQQGRPVGLVDGGQPLRCLFS